jgi:3-oxoacyl-[acyl-carrier protein] reductase
MSKPELINKNIVIIGATGGIGKVLTKSLIEQNNNLFLVSKNNEKLEELKNIYKVPTLEGDISDSIFAKELFLQAKSEIGEIDGIINLVGSITLKPAHLTSDLEWDFTIRQNLTSSFNCIRFGFSNLSKNSSIVLISSVAGQIGLANHEAISAAKAGVIGLTKSSAASYANKGLRVNCIAPGLVRTPLSQRITDNAAALKASTAFHPLGRIGEANDIVPVIEFLLSDNSSWVTGQVFGIDGGFSTVRI